MFLALGLGTLIALEMLLISGGVLGVIPLSGVVSPFLSSGNTAMLSNFLIFGILFGISNQPAAEGLASHFRRPVRVVALAMTAAALFLVWRAAYFQVLHDRGFTGARRHGDSGRRGATAAVQSAIELAGAGNCTRVDLRPQWRAHRHQQTGRNWSGIAPSTKNWACRLTRRARGPRRGIIRSARRRCICWAICGPAKIFMLRTRRSSSTISTASCRVIGICTSWGRWCGIGISRRIRKSGSCSRGTATCMRRLTSDCRLRVGEIRTAPGSGAGETARWW